MNTIICLSTRSYRYCIPILYQNHYELETIECNFNMVSGELIDADIILKNPQLNNLFILECKAGGLEKEQAKRYASLSHDDITNANITTLSGNFSHEVAYLTDAENRDKLVDGISKNSWNFPVICQNGDKLSLVCNSIKCPTLNKLFTDNAGVSIPKDLPMLYYPFGKDDSDAHILNCIGPILIKFRGQEFTVEDILFNTHRIYEHISDSAIKGIKGRLGKIINDLSKGEMNEFFNVPQSKPYSLKNFGPKRFQNQLEGYIAKSNQDALKETQLPLKDFGNNLS